MITAARSDDVNGDGLADLSITVNLGEEQLTRAEQSACVKALPDPKRKTRLFKLVTKEYRIDFLFDGKEFNVAPASEPAAALKLFPETELPI